ncbi:MAG TPA: hypothetical protein VMZ91_12030 [Candidatus Paceibacterota bacterium]|nr:hypothetical protein [Candidatus Paceibacterota bacterium]
MDKINSYLIFYKEKQGSSKHETIEGVFTINDKDIPEEDQYNPTDYIEFLTHKLNETYDFLKFTWDVASLIKPTEIHQELLHQIYFHLIN